MEPNFPHGTTMDSHLANIQSIIQVQFWLFIPTLFCVVGADWPADKSDADWIFNSPSLFHTYIFTSVVEFVMLTGLVSLMDQGYQSVVLLQSNPSNIQSCTTLTLRFTNSAVYLWIFQSVSETIGRSLREESVRCVNFRTTWWLSFPWDVLKCLWIGLTSFAKIPLFILSNPLSKYNDNCPFYHYHHDNTTDTVPSVYSFSCPLMHWLKVLHTKVKYQYFNGLSWIQMSWPKTRLSRIFFISIRLLTQNCMRFCIKMATVRYFTSVTDGCY